MMRSPRVIHRMDKKGFTLTELLIVIAIIGALLGIASLSYNSMMDRLNAEKQMKEMFTDLMKARVRAMQRNRTHFVVFNASQYTIYEDTDPAPDGDGQLAVGLDQMVLQKGMMAKFPVAYPNSWTANPNEPLSFNAKGLVPADPYINVTAPLTVPAVRITTPIQAEYDCLVVSEIKIILGKWDGASSVCIGK